jgi:hypothetical protein
MQLSECTRNPGAKSNRSDAVLDRLRAAGAAPARASATPILRIAGCSKAAPEFPVKAAG